MPRGRGFSKSEEKIVWLCLGGFLILISLLLITVLAAQYYRANELRFWGAKTTGTIYDIRTEFIGTGSPRTTVYYRYAVDGKEYADILSYYSPKMRAGDRIDVYYTPDNPGISSGGSETGYVALGIGVMFLVLAAGFFAVQAGVRGW
ncbi:MAG: DUF3592 domain-containing protein [Deltaproteobacteria bacterium]|nr:DUF3592 domain-containing protein [Deltaproteobacteria bacterium]